MPPRLRLLCIGGHPADTFDGAGGTLAHHVQDGDEVTVVALTAGTRIHDVVISDSMRARDRIPERGRARRADGRAGRGQSRRGQARVRLPRHHRRSILRLRRRGPDPPRGADPPDGVAHPRGPPRRHHHPSPERARRVRQPPRDDRAARPQRDRCRARGRDGRPEPAAPSRPGLLHDPRAGDAVQRHVRARCPGIRISSSTSPTSSRPRSGRSTRCAASSTAATTPERRSRWSTARWGRPVASRTARGS